MSQHYLLILITVACALLPPTWVTLSELRRMRHSTPAAECDREAMVGVVVCDLLGSAVASLVVYAVQKAGSIDFTDQVFQQDPASRRAPSVVLVLLVAVGAGLGGRRALVAAERSRDVAWARLTPTQVLVVKSLRTVRSNALDRYAASIARWETKEAARLMRTFTRTPLNQFANDVLTFIHFRHLTGLIDARSLHFQTPSAVGVLQAAIVKILNDTQRHDRERFRQLIALMFEIGGYEEVVRLSQLPPAAGNPPILCACRGGTTHATGCPLAP